MAIAYKQSDLVSQVRDRVDDTPDSTTVVEWLNAGLNAMAMKVGAIFPPLSTADGSSQLPFDDKWAEIPVLYACHRFKLTDLMYTDANMYLQQFNNLLNIFVTSYTVPPQYQDSPYAQQFVATTGQTSFTITNETFDPLYNGITVYKNNQKLSPNTDYSYNADSSTFLLLTSCVGGEYVTVVWNPDLDIQRAPFVWWEKMGW